MRTREVVRTFRTKVVDPFRRFFSGATQRMAEELVDRALVIVQIRSSLGEDAVRIFNLLEGKRMTIREIAEQLDLSTDSVGSLITDMTAQGFLVKADS